MASRGGVCVRSQRRGRGGAARRLAVLALAALASARPAAGFEYFDGRIQVHGFVEEQVRSIAKNFSTSNGWDLSQWYNVLNVLTDFNIAPNGVGPFDLVHGFVRAEVRYDCIWTRACGMFPSVNVWGNRAEKEPNRLVNGHNSGYTGTLVNGDFRRFSTVPIDQVDYSDLYLPYGGRYKPAYIWDVPGVNTLFGIKDPLQTPQASDDPAFYVFGKFIQPGHEYRFDLRQTNGQPNGVSQQVLGPWLPENHISPLATLAYIANPFNPQDVNPVLVPASLVNPNVSPTGSGALPYRPAPDYPASQAAPNGHPEAARGLFIPNEAVARLIQKHEFDQFDQNFSQAELAWNHGASQQETRELKEAYIDLEMLDSRLWIRAGKQNIVWGKTELFRTTDQFNPQDLALATLPSLEESRIALNSVRAVYSFYSVGPVDDLRLEVAANFDKFQPTDLGRCGEPYTPNPVCDKSAGLFAHGIAGSALAGEHRPPDPWNNLSGSEIGARLEGRWDRFSFALTDFWGYDDFPYVDQVFSYERNVDPVSGRPRRAGMHTPCRTGNEPSCLQPGDDALLHTSVNQQRFALICASSVGFSSLDRSACAQSVFNSNKSALTGVPNAAPTVTELLGTIMSGSNVGRATVISQFFPGLLPLPAAQAYPIVRLNHDPGDGAGSGAFGINSLSYVLSDQQEALLGCGPIYRTSCDVSTTGHFGGVDLLNAELSVLIQSWPGFPGTTGTWLLNAGPNGPIQPGTIRDCGAHPGAPGCAGSTGLVPYLGGAVASRYEGGQRYTIAGAHSPFPQATDLRYGPVPWSASVDGCVRASDPGCAGAHDLRQPYSGDYFMSELGAFSWNYLMLLVSFSTNGTKPEVPCAPGQNTNTCRQVNEFIATPAYYLRTNGCSYARPDLCSNVFAIYSIAHTTRNIVKAGGNAIYGRTDFDWDQAGAGILRYQKRNVLGFSTDFAEDHTKTNWGIESTWIANNQFEDHNQFDNLTQSSTLNMTVSVDRPTFINFLNSGRTFFFNSQWFFQYMTNYKSGFTQPGPFNVLATFHVDTGYFRDRLLPALTFVYDVNSRSGAILPEIAYRFTENFSATISLNLFSGRWQKVTPQLAGIADLPYRAGSYQNHDWTEAGLSPIRDNDEVAMRIRYTF